MRFQKSAARWRNPERIARFRELWQTRMRTNEIIAALNEIPGEENVRTVYQLRDLARLLHLPRGIPTWWTAERTEYIKAAVAECTPWKDIYDKASAMPGPPVPHWRHMQKSCAHRGIKRPVKQTPTVPQDSKPKPEQTSFPPRRCMRCRVSFDRAYRDQWHCVPCRKWVIEQVE